MEKLTRENLETFGGFSMAARFVPLSQSRNADAGWESINWEITINRHGKPVLTTPYAQGIGHLPGWKQNVRRTLDVDAAIKDAVEHGRWDGKFSPNPYSSRKRPNIPAPSLKDVMYSLMMDGEADLDAMTFADWCAGYGYEEDSRKAEKMYNECIRIGRALRQVMNCEEIDSLRESYQDY